MFKTGVKFLIFVFLNTKRASGILDCYSYAVIRNCKITS